MQVKIQYFGASKWGYESNNQDKTNKKMNNDEKDEAYSSMKMWQDDKINK